MKKVERNYAVQGLRGIACLIVFLGHFRGMYVSAGLFDFTWFRPLNLFFDGSIAVVVFFVISSFYMANYLTESMSYFGLIKKRCFRLMPEFWLTCIIGWLLCILTAGTNYELLNDWANSFWNRKVSIIETVRYLCLQGDYKLINPPTWTVRVEINITLFGGFVFWLIIRITDSLKRKFDTKECKKVIYAFEIIVLMVMGVVSVVLDIYKLPVVNYYIMPVFYLGALMYVILCQIKCEYITKIEEVSLIIFTILLLDARHIIKIDNQRVSDYLVAVGACLVLLLVYKGKIVRRILQRNYLIKLGEISYEFYLVHFLVLLILRKAYTGDNARVLIVVSFFVSVVFAYGLKTIDKKLRVIFKG